MCGGTEHKVTERHVKRAWCVRHEHHCSGCGSSLEMRIPSYSPGCWGSPRGALSEPQRTPAVTATPEYVTVVRSWNAWHNVQPNASCSIGVSSWNTKVAFSQRFANGRQRVHPLDHLHSSEVMLTAELQHRLAQHHWHLQVPTSSFSVSSVRTLSLLSGVLQQCTF